MSDNFHKDNFRLIETLPHLKSVLLKMMNLSAGQLVPEKNPNDLYLEHESKSGHPTLSITSHSTNKVYTYHSKYDPVTEAVRQVDSILKDQSHCMILGMGMGYSVEAVKRRLPPCKGRRRILVIEPDIDIFRIAITRRNLQDVLSDDGIDWCVGATPDEVGERWSAKLDWTDLESLAIVEHPPSRQRFHGYFERIFEKLHYLCNRSKGNLITIMHAGYTFHTNYFANIRALLDYPGVARLFGRFSGIPAVVVASGPSLEKNVHLLERVKGRFLIISVDTAFRQLVSRGIKPDIVCAADPSYENSLDFVGVENEKDVLLAIEPMTHPDIIESFAGPKMIMTFGGGITQIVEPQREPIGTLISWGSIATTAFDLARKLNCDPIIFIGLDLSFQDGKLYARGSYSDDLLYDRVNQFTSLEQETAEYIADHGRHRYEKPGIPPLYTDNNMNLYRKWFEDQFRSTSQTVINATEGGIVENHVRIMPFADVIENYSGDANISKILSDALEAPVKISLKKLERIFAGILKDLRLHQNAVKKAVNSCRKLARMRSETVVKNLTGPASADFQDILNIHDELCGHSTLFQWFSIHQAKFVTRHTMEIKRLRDLEKSTVKDWLEELTAFFESMTRFHEYQIPPLENVVIEAGKPQNSLNPPSPGEIQGGYTP